MTDRGVSMTHGISKLPWPARTAEHRWYGLGRYYAMFPAPFVTRAVRAFTEPGDVVLDPFSGRGNAPFLAAALGRPAVAIDILPVAWLFTAAKMLPARRPSALLTRMAAVRSAIRPADRRARSRFERMAWNPQVLGFLRAARRELRWEESRVDRTLMAFVALHMQDNYCKGLSNRLSPTVAHSAPYAVRWWTKRGMFQPPDTEPAAFLNDRIRRRYAYGTPGLARSTALLGDARTKLRHIRCRRANLLITSPPYHDVTDYWNDHWLRLWLLGEPMTKDWKRTQKHTNLEAYRSLLHGVFGSARRHVREDGFVLVRCGAKEQTVRSCEEAVRAAWPHRTIMRRHPQVARRGVASGYRHGAKVVEEVDLVAVPEGGEGAGEGWAGVPDLADEVTA